MKKNVDRQVKIWYTLGRVAPIGALFLLIICLVFDIESWINYLLIGIATVFAVIAFTWWWWVLDTVKELFNMLKTELSDSCLISLYSKGNEEAMSILVDRHKSRIFTTIYLIVKDRYIAEDILQDVFIKTINIM